MKGENNRQIGHSILKYKVRLYDRHLPWLLATREMYQKVVFHFYAVLAKKEELLALSDFTLLRELETLCIGTREMKKAGIVPDYPLPEDITAPLYFRRSAINGAIDLARKKAASKEVPAEISEQDVSRVPMVLYQGMYREFGENSIELKLYDGERWNWVTYPFTGRTIPKEAKRLSPLLVLEKKSAWLEVPLSFPVEDIRTVKERMQEEDSICAVTFPDDDILAAAVILSKDGEELEHRMFRGGRQKEHQRGAVLEQIEKSRESRGRLEKAHDSGPAGGLQQKNSQENRQLYHKLEEINSYFAHKISRELVDYCVEQHIKVIVVPNYEISMSDYRKQFGVDVYRWLGRSIIKKMKYKAFQQGIVVTTIRPHHISDRCSECGETIKRYNEGHTPGKNYYGGRLYLCPKGHKGNSALNTARNVGKRFLSYVPQ